MSVAVAERLEQALQARMTGEQLGGAAALEQLAPLGRDGVRVLQVLVQQEAGIAGVQAIDVAVCHGFA